MKVPYTNLEDGNAASANDINQRFGDVLAQVNGGLDATNIKKASLTRELLASDAIQAAWPVNSVYISLVNVNPAAQLGGNWVRFANGRVLVGVDETQTEFNEAEKTSGVKDVTLTQAQMPVHAHAGTTSVGGHHSHGITADLVATSGSGGARAGSAGGQQLRWGFGGGIAGGGDHNHTFATDNRGSGQAHTNLQPGIAVFMWKRVS